MNNGKSLFLSVNIILRLSKHTLFIHFIGLIMWINGVKTFGMPCPIPHIHSHWLTHLFLEFECVNTNNENFAMKIIGEKRQSFSIALINRHRHTARTRTSSFSLSIYLSLFLFFFFLHLCFSVCKCVSVRFCIHCVMCMNCGFLNETIWLEKVPLIMSQIWLFEYQTIYGWSMKVLSTFRRIIIHQLCWAKFVYLIKWF